MLTQMTYLSVADLKGDDIITCPDEMTMGLYEN